MTIGRELSVISLVAAVRAGDVETSVAAVCAGVATVCADLTAMCAIGDRLVAEKVFELLHGAIIKTNGYFFCAHVLTPTRNFSEIPYYIISSGKSNTSSRFRSPFDKLRFVSAVQAPHAAY